MNNKNWYFLIKPQPPIKRTQMHVTSNTVSKFLDRNWFAIRTAQNGHKKMR